MAINKKKLKEWINALRSGEYKQARLTLAHRGIEETNKYCCLGVLCDLHLKTDPNSKFKWTPSPGLKMIEGEMGYGTKKKNPASFPLKAVREWIGMSMSEMRRLAKMNDNRHMTFKEIAAWLEGRYLDAPKTSKDAPGSKS